MVDNSDDEELILHDFDPEVATVSYSALNNIFNNSLHARITLNDVEGVQQLIAKGCELNLVDNSGYMALHIAVLVDKLDIVKILLKQPNLRYDTQSHFGETPLFLSLKSECSDETISLLIDHGCNIFKPNNENVTPLHLAVRRINTSIGHKLILKGANINSKDRDGYTPLHEAAIRGNLDNVCMLLFYGALPDEKTYFSKATPFMMACSNNYRLETARYLIDYIPDLEETDDNGLTPLLIALKRKSDIALDLVQRGANVHVMESTTPCIQFSLYYKTSHVFEALWCRMDYKKILNLRYSILNNILTYSTFPIDQLLKCVYIIFESPYIYDIVYQFTKTGVYLYSRIAQYKNIVLEERIKIYYLFLSYGVTVYFNDICNLYLIHGFDKSLEVILTSGCCIHRCEGPGIDNLLFNRICYNALKIPLRLLHEDSKLDYYRFYIRGKEEPARLQNIIRIRHLEAPSLLQLSRDVIRATLFETCSKPHIFNVYKAITSLEVPQRIKDILFLKQSIYEDK